MTQEKADKSSPSPSRAVPSNSTRLASQPLTTSAALYPDPELLLTITDEPFVKISSITTHHFSEPTEALIPPVKNLSPSAWCSRSWGAAPSSYPTQRLPKPWHTSPSQICFYLCHTIVPSASNTIPSLSIPFKTSSSPTSFKKSHYRNHPKLI